MRRRGLALSEVMMAAALFSLLLTVALACVSTYSRAFRQLTDRHPSSPGLARALGESTRCLREGAILWPGTDRLEAGFSPTRDEPLRLECGDALFFDSVRQVVLRRHEERETVLGEATGMRVLLVFSGRHRLLALLLDDQPGRPPWQTKLALP